MLIKNRSMPNWESYRVAENVVADPLGPWVVGWGSLTARDASAGIEWSSDGGLGLYAKGMSIKLIG